MTKHQMYIGDYVEFLNILDVTTKVIPCITGSGVPDDAEGAVGCLYMNETNGLMYKYMTRIDGTKGWEPLTVGMSIISAKISEAGVEEAYFAFNELRTPEYYSMKIGDLIVDTDGYLYQVSQIDSEGCTATYCGTRIGGVASGDKDFRLAVVKGKLQLLTEGGRVLNAVECVSTDGETIVKDPETGILTVTGIKTVDGDILKLFVGTKAKYEEFTPEQQEKLFAIITDGITTDDILAEIKKYETGELVVQRAEVANTLRQNTTEVGTVPASGKFIALGSGAAHLISFKPRDFTKTEQIFSVVLYVPPKGIMADCDVFSTPASIGWRCEYTETNYSRNIVLKFYDNKGEAQKVDDVFIRTI